MKISCYLHKDTIYIPTLHEIEHGYHRKREPIDAVSAMDSARLLQSIFAAVARGNPPMSRDEASRQMRDKDQPMLQATGMHSWGALDRQLKGSWSIAENEGAYKIKVWRPMEPRGWEEDSDQEIQFPPKTSLEEVAIRLISMIQERNQK